MPKVGLIAGSGFYEPGGDLRLIGTNKIDTPYGEPSGDYSIYESEGIRFAFLPRHGSPHRIAPHMINYKANMWGFKEMGVERIISINAVGGIKSELKPGDLIVPDQVIDKTHGRASTFYDRDEIVHVDFTMPFCGELREAVFRAGNDSSHALWKSGNYICVNGPRLESRAEIEYFARIGADIVGMTAMPEACLARELELCFAIVAVVTNYAAGVSSNRLTTKEVVEMMKASSSRIRNLVLKTLGMIPEKRACACKDALRESRL